MRIRKRKVPLPFSLLSPVPISDPHLFTRSPATLHHHQPPPNPPSTTTTTISASAQPPPPSDHPDLRPLIVGGDGTPATSTDIQEHLYCLGERKHEEKNGDGSNPFTGAPPTTTTGAGAVAVAPNDNNNNNNNNNGPVLPVSNHQEDEKGSWSDRERVVPLKKRRSSCFEESSSSSQQAMMSPNSSIMKSKTNKLCVEFGHDHQSSKPGEQVKKHDLNLDLNHNTSNNVVGVGGNDNGNNDNGGGGGGGGGKAMRGSGKRGNTIMEGSRCSRVNGRGWRCCQPTLVGYSLCEHHLGKGRLRSMSSAGGGGASANSTGRGRSGLNSSKKAVLGQSSSLALSSPPAKPAAAEDEDDEAEIKPVMSTVNSLGKRVKLGVVKARSLSSLLGQTTQTQTQTQTQTRTQTQSDNNNNSDAAKATTTLEVVQEACIRGSSSHGGLV